MAVYTVRVGERYGRLTVISEIYVKHYGKNRAAFRMVDCVCECGGRSTHPVNQIAKGRTKSCGCWNREVTTLRNLKHGGAPRGSGKKDPLYGVWSSIKTRCYNPHCKSYCSYGARGIVMCDEWRDSFAAFRDWALQTGYIAFRLTIDRIDTNAGYSPDNCRWLTKSQQNRNRRVHRMLTIFGETKPAFEWAEDSRCMVRPATFRDRLTQGWEPERALTAPITNGRIAAIRMDCA